ncbi:hypothetical protein PG994_000900 [Apiospora phragmitis]|uniref:RlpA-like protein double-psi beta-barrel domain-containing protein n=1 Tax=Apiospora phragmitis TaxID=2905665 RepID=A0ABR1WS47_9PEZI
MTEPQPPQPVYQTPDWETPSHPPRASLLDRIKEWPLRKNAPLFVRTPSDGTQHAPAKEVAAGRAPPAQSPPTRSPLQRRLDAILPPHRTYLGGRSRRFLLLSVAALVLVLVLALAIGLGVGLSHNKKNSTKNLPLPSNHGVFTGDLTYYGPGLGACGVTSSGQDSIVSVSHITFDAAGANRGSGGNPNANPLCGRKIRIQRDYKEDGGAGNRSVDVTVVDRCTGCQPADLDVSISVFTQLAPEDRGRVLVSWAWLE